VLSEDAYRKNALRLRRSIQEAGGIKTATDIIEKTLATGHPMIQ
jgi:UDP:flavonoid glycosyltransferase YjiC (YdhE family)